MNHLLSTFAAILVLSSKSFAQTAPVPCSESCPRMCYFGLCPLPPAEEQTDSSVPRAGSFKNWAIFDEFTFAGRQCWLATAPVKMTGLDRRDQVVLLYNMTVEQVSIGTKAPSFEALFHNHSVVGDFSFQFLFEGSYGWPASEKEDKQIKQQLLAGEGVTVESATAMLQFSALGFSEAYQFAKETCVIEGEG